MNIKLCSNRFKLQSYCVLFKILDDGGFGVGMDLALKSHTQHGLNTFMYEFDYRSQQNDNPEWIGKYNGVSAVKKLIAMHLGHVFPSVSNAPIALETTYF